MKGKLFILVLLLSASLLFYLKYNQIVIKGLKQKQQDKEKENNEQFLSNWFKNLRPFIGKLNLLDISLPGSHDTLSYDLTTTVSDRANDLPLAISYLLHHYGKKIPQLGEYIRQQGKTQGIDITAQLNSGLRFIDFRVIYTRNLNNSKTHPNEQDWYSLHLLQSNQKAISYFKQIRDFLEINDQEIVVIWISKHGNPCANGSDQYPSTSVKVKQSFWQQIKGMFSGMLFDASKQKLNETTIDQLISTNQRVVIYAADYEEFTGKDSFAQDSCLIENVCGGDVNNEVQAYQNEMSEWKNASNHKAIIKSQNRFWLRQLAAGTPGKKYLYTVLMEAFGGQQYTQPCADIYNIPNNTFCPVRLQDEGQLTNYYKQLSFDHSSKLDYEFSNAIYIDAIDAEGTIRTGYKTYGVNEFEEEQGAQEYQTQKYAYMWVLIKANLQKFCRGNPSKECDQMKAYLQENIDKYPLTMWNDVGHGRVKDWPVAQTYNISNQN